MINSKPNFQMLSNALLGNAIFSGLGGLIFLFDASILADLIGIQSMIFTVTGISLVIFSGFLVWLRNTQPNFNTKLVWAVIIMDLLWVLDSAILLLTDIMPITSTGTWVIAALADMVLGFAFWQYFGLRRLKN